MASAQLERTASSVRESMAAFQRSASSVKLDQGATPILARTGSMLASPDAKLNKSPTMSPKEVALCGGSPAIRNRNVVIGILSTLLILAVSWHSFSPEEIPVYEAVSTTSRWSHGQRAMPYKEFVESKLVGGSKFLVSDPAIALDYHNGLLLTALINVHIIFYGSWTATQVSILTDFIKSFDASSAGKPSVAGWWSITKNFKDKKKASVAQQVVLGEVLQDTKYSLKKNLLESDIKLLIGNAVSSKKLPIDSNAVYLVLTSADVSVQGFCDSQCGTHSYTRSPATNHKILPFVWVGNPAKYCAGTCAWPYAKAPYGAGPNTPPLKSPNNDVGVDGMCITVASMLVGAATNTLDDGYYQGVASDGYEAVAVCGGIYGSGAYPGYPGQLLKSKAGASYNVNGINGRKFLCPFMFDPATKKCALQS